MRDPSDLSVDYYTCSELFCVLTPMTLVPMLPYLSLKEVMMIRVRTERPLNSPCKV